MQAKRAGAARFALERLIDMAYNYDGAEKEQ